MEETQGVHQSAVYRIQVLGVLTPEWQSWFNGMELTDNGRCTTLQGLVRDQPALFGLLIKIRDLGLTVLSVQRLEDH